MVTGSHIWQSFSKLIDGHGGVNVLGEALSLAALNYNVGTLKDSTITADVLLSLTLILPGSWIYCVVALKI